MSNPQEHSTPEENARFAHAISSDVSPDDQLLGTLARALLLAVALWLILLGLFNLRHPSDWAMGDWLINYSGGFVRRGLIGQLALLLRKLHLPPLVTVLCLQWILYALVLRTSWLLLRGLRWQWWSAAFVFSPATFAFVLLDPPFAFRKEILFFALLALILREFLPPARRENSSRNLRLTLLLACGGTLCLLAHEGLVVFLPYLAAAVALGLRNLRAAAALLAAPLALWAMAFAVVSHHPGNPATAATVCHSIGGTLTQPPSGICGGAIDYLTKTPAQAHADVARIYTGASARLLPVLFLLPLLPAAIGLLDLRAKDAQATKILLICTAAAWLLSVSLFFYGTDWTRWIYIHVFSLLLLMLFTERQQPQGRGDDSHAVFHRNGHLRWAATLALVLYCFGWHLTVYGQRPLYGSFVRYVTHNLLRGQQ